MIEVVDLPEQVIIGILVEAPWQMLATSVPASWTRLFAAGTGATSFLEASLALEGGVYREIVGYLAAHGSDVPDGMTRVVIQPQRYLRLRHEGPLAGIAESYGRLLDHAVVAGLTPTDLKLDFGYLPGLPDGPHELHVAIAPEQPQRA